MGFAVSWLAVLGREPQQVYEALRLVPTGHMQGFPEAPFTSAGLASGWLLVYANAFNTRLADEALLKALSPGCRVLACQVEEHVMFSAASLYSGGARVWRVAHDAQQGIDHLQVQGSAPAALRQIEAAARLMQAEAGGAQAGVDYIYEIPLALAERLTAFRHDGAVAVELLYRVLEHRR